ncbi:hypothetical protein [Shiella aurantiaca]|uniref:hypothetical protein n=1 Tax=Shiella aurantiaca TaxID=3058365 RepID=UPI0029F5B0C0|nr:hypothetical protein [Shiella aurantiaca]
MKRLSYSQIIMFFSEYKLLNVSINLQSSRAFGRFYGDYLQHEVYALLFQNWAHLYNE